MKTARSLILLICLTGSTIGCGNADDEYSYDEPMRMMPQNPSWRPVTIATDKSRAVAVDDSSIKKGQGKAKAWVAALSFEYGIDNGKIDANYYREFDCDQARYRTLKSTNFLEEDVPEFESNDNNWIDAPVGSMNEHVLNYVCFGRLP